MTIGITELPPEGMQLGGVVLAGDTARGTRTTEGLSLLFTTAGITVQGPQPQIERLLVWSGLDSATCNEKIAMADGRNAAVMELTSGGQSIRFLLPTDTVSPGQAAYLDQALPAWLARYRGNDEPLAREPSRPFDRGRAGGGGRRHRAPTAPARRPRRDPRRRRPHTRHLHRQGHRARPRRRPVLHRPAPPPPAASSPAPPPPAASSPSPATTRPSPAPSSSAHCAAHTATCRRSGGIGVDCHRNAQRIGRYLDRQHGGDVEAPVGAAIARADDGTTSAVTQCWTAAARATTGAATANLPGTATWVLSVDPMPEGTAWDNPPIGEDLAIQPVPTKKRWGWRKAKAPAAPLAATRRPPRRPRRTRRTRRHGGGRRRHGFCVCPPTVAPPVEPSTGQSAAPITEPAVNGRSEAAGSGTASGPATGTAPDAPDHGPHRTPGPPVTNLRPNPSSPQRTTPSRDRDARLDWWSSAPSCSS